MPEEAKPWSPPTSDVEFKFEKVESAPNWIDKGWASWDNGPALAIPMGDLYGEGPYHSSKARVGDTVKFVAATGSKAGHFVIIPGEPDAVGQITKRQPQVTNASVEDQLKTGNMSPADLSDADKGQVIARSPKLKDLIEGNTPAPKPAESTVKV